ncbi:unnamed protein product [Heterosigma akashiwo]
MVATNILSGAAVIAVGIFFAVCATLKSDFIVFRLCVERSKLCWGDKTYRFYQVVAGMLIVFGALLIAGVMPFKQ